MRNTQNQVIGKAGALHVAQIVNDHGSVFRPVHQEDDFGIDGFIEFVQNEEVTGRLVAIQIKSGESYTATSGEGFEIAVDGKHLHYWQHFMVPVILVGYSPERKIAAWVSVRDYVEREQYHGRWPAKSITIPFTAQFTTESLSSKIAGLARIRADERMLARCADRCLSKDPLERRGAFQILSQHPDSRNLRLTCLIARQLLMDEDVELAKDAIHTLGYGVGRNRWSWAPGNRDEQEVICYASELVRTLTEPEIRRTIELVDDEYFHGPRGLGERCFDIVCCSESAWQLLDDIVYDQTQPIERRANCLYMQLECDPSRLEEEAEELRADARLKGVVDYLIPPADQSH